MKYRVIVILGDGELDVGPCVHDSYEELKEYAKATLEVNDKREIAHIGWIEWGHAPDPASLYFFIKEDLQNDKSPDGPPGSQT